MFPQIDPLQWIADRLNEVMQAWGFTHHARGPGVLQPLFDLVQKTSLDLTTQNPIIHQVWFAMVGASDILLGLFVIISVIQSMYGQSTGTISMPPGQIIGRAILTGILINMSAFFCENLLILNNLFCEIAQVNLQNFIANYNDGQAFSVTKQLIVSISLAALLNFGMFRLLAQGIKRLIRLNVLIGLAGLAVLTSYHETTSAIFFVWLRILFTTTFEQFLQRFTLFLGIQFLVTTKFTGLLGFVLAIAMLHLAAEIPPMLARFSANGGNNNGLGALFSTVARTAVLFS